MIILAFFGALGALLAIAFGACALEAVFEMFDSPAPPPPPSPAAPCDEMFPHSLAYPPHRWNGTSNAKSKP